MAYEFNRKTVAYGDDITVVVREAGRRQGLRRMDLVQEALAWLEAQGYKLGEVGDVASIPADVWQTFLVARFERSACLAAAESIQGIPDEWLTIEGFADLMPEQLVVEWSNTAYDLNDHWERVYRYGVEIDAEKKSRLIRAEQWLDERLLGWMASQDERPVYEDAEETGDDWGLNRAEHFALWALGEALGWQIEPWAGGFAEWPDAFVEDLMKIQRRKGQLKELRKTGAGPSRDLGEEWKRSE